VPNKNREFVKVVNKYDKPQAQQPGDDYREKIEKAMRRSAYGEPLKVILADLKTDLGNRYTDDIGNRIASDHGLHGNVYIREEAFKGLFNGKWDKQIKARCASAKYIIPASKDCVFDYHQGRKVVSNINWKSAFEHYAPKLKTVGIKLGSGTNYQARLKQAFLSQAPAQVQPQTWFAYQEDLTKKYSSEQAQSKFANYIPKQIEVESFEERQASLLERKFNKLASKVIKAGIVKQSDLDSLIEKDISLEKKFDLLGKYATQKIVSEKKTYSGQEWTASNSLKAHDNNFSSLEKELDARIQDKTATDKNLAERNLKNVQSLVNARIISNEQAYKFASQGKSPQEMYLLVLKEAKNLYAQPVYTANNLLSETNNTFESFDSLNDRQGSTHLKAIDNKIAKLVKSNLLTNQEVNSLSQIKDPNKKLAKALGIIEQKVSSQKKDYTDTQYTQHIETKKASVKLASKDTVETWLRQKMAEGAVGNDLDVMLKARFASEVLDHYADSIKAIRTAHEGLSGQVYVDAGAYEKVGCEQGALQHRSNMIPAVLQMDKCATCVFKNAEGTCQKYNKPVIASLSQMGIDNPKKYQKESIRLANASDSEKTASLFVNNYDADEFNLTTNDEIEIETDTNKTPDGLKDVLFGGFEF
jgi:predicted Zn-dependent protease with MMP-like domain